MLQENQIVILYSHHCKSDVTLHHYNLLKKYNPNIPVVPVGFTWHELIDGSHITSRQPYFPNNQLLNIHINGGKSTSTESDLILYDFYIQNQNYKSYFLFEWDTYCNCSIEEFYGDKLTLDNFCSLHFNDTNVHEWSWYNTLTSAHKRLPKLGGIYPTSGVYLKREVLHKMVEILINNPSLYDNMQNEIRLGTLVQQAGYKINQLGNDFIDFYEHQEYLNNIKNGIKGYYHPIKEII